MARTMSRRSAKAINANDARKPGGITAMISSTALDLPEHRALVHKACLEAGVFPIGMEQLPARDANGIKVSLEMVDKADVYLGIYAWRYGWVPDGKDISVTEMEYGRAVERKADDKLTEILVFVADAKHPCEFSDIEADAIAQKKLAAFKMKATKDRGRGKFTSAEDPRRQVLHALLEFKERHSPSPAKKGKPGKFETSIPNNLPSLAPFFGREAELKKIAEALDPDNRTWGALIDGPGGMGKTSLAVRAALGCQPQQFDQIAFVSVKDRELDDDGVKYLRTYLLNGFTEMLNEMANRLGQSDIAKLPEDQRVKVLHEALRGRKVLLILDNLESLDKADRDRLFEFVKRLPQGNKAILTSRRRIGSGAEVLILEKLTQDAALAMLDELTKHIPLLAKTDEADRIKLYNETAGKPLLLRWTAGQIGRAHCRTIDDAIAFLRSCPKDNDPLDFIFGDLATQFTEDETRTLCALTYFTQPTAIKHIATVAGLEKELIESALKTLANRSLVVPDPEERAFVLVPMVADFLRKHRPTAVAETGNRLVNRAIALAIENGNQRYERFEKLEEAWPTVAAALPQLIAGPNGRLQAVCTALWQFLDYTGRWDELLALSRDGEGMAAAAGDRFSAGKQSTRAGGVYARRGQSSEVFACADRADAHFRDADVGNLDRAGALHLRGWGHGIAQDFPAAIAVNREALELVRATSPESGMVASSLNHLAWVERLSGDLDSAERDWREALRIAKAVDSTINITRYTGHLAELALDREEWATAEALAREALAFCERAGGQELIANNNFRLAKALTRQGRKTDGLPHARIAVETLARLRSSKFEEALQTLAECEAQ
jgi:tetratricopeptide (TPR) repeat protein